MQRRPDDSSLSSSQQTIKQFAQFTGARGAVETAADDDSLELGNGGLEFIVDHQVVKFLPV
jgi:hypothetical protein